MPYKDKSKHLEWQRENRENTFAKKLRRREYERERKRRKRLEQINLLPEPERSKKLSKLRGPYARSLF
jgi:hypothetical protein